MIEVVGEELPDVEVVVPRFVSLDAPSHRRMPDHKVQCTDCERWVLPNQARPTPDGFVCSGCRDES